MAKTPEPDFDESFGFDITLADARREFFRRYNDGLHCPCCDRWAQVCGRRLNCTMARGLIWLYHRSIQEGGYVDVPKAAPKSVTNTNQHTTLKWWGLVERVPSDDPKKKHSGLWRPTYRGRLFVLDRIKVPEKIWTYNDQVLRVSPKETTIREALASGGFDYREVMGQ